MSVSAQVCKCKWQSKGDRRCCRLSQSPLQLAVLTSVQIIWNESYFELQINTWKWTWSTNNASKWLKKNLNKFSLAWEWNSDLYNDGTQCSTVSTLYWANQAKWRTSHNEFVSHNSIFHVISTIRSILKELTMACSPVGLSISMDRALHPIIAKSGLDSWSSLITQLCSAGRICNESTWRCIWTTNTGPVICTGY